MKLRYAGAIGHDTAGLLPMVGPWAATHYGRASRYR